MRHSTTKVLSASEWMNRVANEKAQHDCQRHMFNQKQKQDLMTCRQVSATSDEQYKFYIPTFVIEDRFGIRKSESST
jgi:nicotinamide mononucleotide adenylyltransferase